MNKLAPHLTLLSKLTRGRVYRRDELVLYSNSVDRELKQLETSGDLKKVGPGLYYYPKISRFGSLPPDEKNLVLKFLNTDDFLLMSDNWYNSLGLGLTQLSTTARVYNNKRHALLKLAGQEYYFQRPNNGFPKKLSKEFLLVDLMNNLNNVGEDHNQLMDAVKRNINKFDKNNLLKLSEKYGRVGTRKFFRELLNDNVRSSTQRCKGFDASYHRAA